jgi:hypothetical protein
MRRENLPAFLIAGMTPQEIEEIRYQAGTKIIEHGIYALDESLAHILGGSFWYRIAMPYHLYKTLLPLLLGVPILRKRGKIATLQPRRSYSSQGSEQ